MDFSFCLLFVKTKSNFLLFSTSHEKKETGNQVKLKKNVFKPQKDPNPKHIETKKQTKINCTLLGLHTYL